MPSRRIRGAERGYGLTFLRELAAHACVIYLRSDCAACVRACVLVVSQNKLEVWVRQQLRLMYGGGFMPNWPGTMAQLRQFETVRLGNDDEELMASIEAWQPAVASQPAAAGKHTINPLFFAMHRTFSDRLLVVNAGDYSVSTGGGGVSTSTSTGAWL